MKRLLNLKTLFPVLAEIEIFPCVSQNLVVALKKSMNPDLPKLLSVIDSLIIYPADWLLFWQWASSIGSLEY